MTSAEGVDSALLVDIHRGGRFRRLMRPSLPVRHGNGASFPRALGRLLENLRRNTHGRRTRWHVAQNYTIGADFCVFTDRDATEYLGPGSDIHVPSDPRRTIFPATESNLLEQEAIGTYLRIRMNDDSIGMWHQQSPAQTTAIQRDIGPSDYAPPTVAQNRDPARQAGPPAA
jgi:hypothetical protein